MLGTIFSDNSLEIIKVHTRSHTASPTPFDENLHDDFNTNDWIIKAKERQALDELAVSQPRLKLLEEQKNGQVFNSSWALKPAILLSFH